MIEILISFRRDENIQIRISNFDSFKIQVLRNFDFFWKDQKTEIFLDESFGSTINFTFDQKTENYD